MVKKIKHVLIVDDEIISQILLKTMLEPLGWLVTLASNGEEAVKRFQEKFFSLIIIDFNMPKMNGVEAVKEIRRWKKEINPYIVGLTACNDRELLEVGLKAGMNEVFVKPISQGSIYKICHRIQQTNLL